MSPDNPNISEVLVYEIKKEIADRYLASENSSRMTSLILPKKQSNTPSSWKNESVLT
jgi:hypothetical protein